MRRRFMAVSLRKDARITSTQSFGTNVVEFGGGVNEPCGKSCGRWSGAPCARLVRQHVSQHRRWRLAEADHQDTGNQGSSLAGHSHSMWAQLDFWGLFSG